jgi:leucyl/phenylalanyl-tRNA--protein transferase
MTLTRLPPSPAESVWDHVPEWNGPGDAPAAVGGDLSPPTMIGAYRRGIVPWTPTDPGTAAELTEAFGADITAGTVLNLSPDQQPSLDLAWWDPDPRCVIHPGNVHISRTLRWRLRRCGWKATLDESFQDVVRACRRGGPNGWITDELVDVYTELHTLGWAHSSEVWAGDTLVGGHFGLLVGSVYLGDSMFHTSTDASKVALADFEDRFAAAGGTLIDVQFASAHLRSMGAVEIARSEFRSALAAARDTPIRLLTDRLPVARLAPPPLPG